jgi:hypothetical protein
LGNFVTPASTRLELSTDIVPKLAQSLKGFFVGYGDCILPWQDHKVCSRGKRACGNPLSEAFSYEPLKAIALNRTFVHFTRHGQPQAGTIVSIRPGQNFEAGIGNNAGLFEDFTKSPFLGKAMLARETHCGGATWLNQ